MAPSTFPQFLHLPRELQIQCWSYAIYNINRIDELPWVGLWQAPDFFRNFEAYKDGYPDDSYIVITSPLTGKRLFAYNYDPLSGLINMMNTCFLARAVACEYWRERRVAKNGPRQDSCWDLEDEVILLDEFIEVLGLRPDVGTTMARDSRDVTARAQQSTMASQQTTPILTMGYPRDKSRVFRWLRH